jgi:RNA polymerase sigma-70 factor, ECF subfamily
MSSRITRSAILPVLRVTTVTDFRDHRDRVEEEVTDLFDQFRKPMLRYLSGFGLALPDGEEVLQETFLSLFQHLDRGKSRDNIPGWLFRVAHNLALKRRNHARRDSETRAEAAVEDLAMDPDPNPEDQMVNRQTQQRLLAVVEALPEQDRRCLFLRAEGLRYREIAEILDISLGAVSLSLARSLARIGCSSER